MYRIIGNEKATVYFQLIALKYRISNNYLQDTKSFWNWQIKQCVENKTDGFTSFAKLNSNNKTNICRVKKAVWTVDERGTMCFTIRADRFLRNMVRSLVGTLVDVGRGRYTPDGFRSIVESRDLSRSSAGAPAQGLFLSDVVYPADIFEHQCFSKFKML